MISVVPIIPSFDIRTHSREMPEIDHSFSNV
jgi:hypothetical protein